MSDSYIYQEYYDLGITNIDKEFNFKDEEWFNPNFITRQICSQCANDFSHFKTSEIFHNMEVRMKHPTSCLWYRYFNDKIKMICPSAKIIRYK